MLLGGLFNPLLLSYVKKSSVEGINLRLVAKKILEMVGINSLRANGIVPNKGSLLIISNHPGVFDSLVLLATVKRKDFYFTALSTYGIFGQEIKKKLLPIYRKRKFSHFLYEYPLSLQIDGKFPENLSLEEMRARNRGTITKASQVINKGHALSIFPTGSVGKAVPGSNWKPGVGHLVKQVNKPDTKVVFCYIKGTKRSDIYAYMRFFIRKLFFKPQSISINFSKTFILDRIIDLTKGPKEITKDLEIKYEEFRSNL